jgi:hypothetical protein
MAMPNRMSPSMTSLSSRTFKTSTVMPTMIEAIPSPRRVNAPATTFQFLRISGCLYQLHYQVQEQEISGI